MRTRFASLALACVVATSRLAIAGDLNPPPGPVQPTNRVQLNAQTITLPHTITQSGSYVFTSDLVGVAGQNGLIIGADNVHIDFNGFALIGVTGSSAAVTTDGPVRSGLVISNGVIRSWDTGTVGFFLNDARAERMNVFACNLDGLWFGDNSIIKDCIARGCGNSGIALNGSGRIVNCIASGNFFGIIAGSFSNHAIVEGCNASNNQDIGISSWGGVVKESVANGNGGSGILVSENALIESCSANENGRVGIECGPRSAIKTCSTNSNGQEGVVANDNATISNCTANQNGFSPVSQIARNSSSGNSPRVRLDEFHVLLQQHREASTDLYVTRQNQSKEHATTVKQARPGQRDESNNSQLPAFLTDIKAGLGSDTEGIFAGNGSTVINCTANSNAGSGILTQADATISNCTAIANGLRGIQTANASRVSGCTTNLNDTGISVSGFSSCVISDCAAEDNTNLGIATSGSATISGCYARDNGSTGFLASGNTTFNNCNARGNGLVGFNFGSSVNVSNCRSDSNVDAGFRGFGSVRIDNCYAGGNGAGGVIVASFCSIINTHCDFNRGVGAPGLSVSGTSRVENCHFTDNDIGILVQGSGNLIIGNSFRVNTTQTSIVPDNTVGPFVSSANIATNTNPHANYTP